MLKSALRKTATALDLLPFLRRMASVARKRRFMRQFAAFEQLAGQSAQRFALSEKDLYPCLTDATTTTPFDRHYVYHPAWAARILAETKPDVHVDISSTLYFCSMVSAFVPVRFYDYRPANLALSNLFSAPADLTRLPFETGSVRSLSCMHTVEHVGLGRYGDPLDYDGDLKAMRELRRVLAPGGDLLFVVPVGKPRVVFNAHRIYSYRQVVDTFGDLKLAEFALIPDDGAVGGLLRNVSPELADQQSYGCGCFWFRRPPD